MRKPLIALLAASLVLFMAGITSALAQPGGHDNRPADKCEASGGMAEGCENHPGEHEEDPDPDPDPDESQCAALAEIEGPLNDNGIPTDGQIQAGCEELENAIAGGGDDDDEGDDDEGEGSDPSCEDLAQVEGPLNDNGIPTDGQIQAGCEELQNTITGNLPA